MKEALDRFNSCKSISQHINLNFETNREGLKPHLMAQPLGYHTPDAARSQNVLLLGTSMIYHFQIWLDYP